MPHPTALDRILVVRRFASPTNWRASCFVEKIVASARQSIRINGSEDFFFHTKFNHDISNVEVGIIE